MLRHLIVNLYSQSVYLDYKGNGLFEGIEPEIDPEAINAEPREEKEQKTTAASKQQEETATEAESKKGEND